MVLEGYRRKTEAGKELVGGQGRVGVCQGEIVLVPLDRPFQFCLLNTKTIYNVLDGLSSGRGE